MKLGIIGLGLIGGSLALSLRKKSAIGIIIGYDQDPANERKALEMGIVDKVSSLNALVAEADAIAICIPVDAIASVLPSMLDMVENQVVFDAGSTKMSICKKVMEHPRRGRFVATHPMWGTEFRGPESARDDAFTGRALVISEAELSDPDALDTVRSLYEQLGMRIVSMSPADHDKHVAYVSHISHVISFALANTVLEKEKQEDAIFTLASGGFESTVRLAKSNSEMWMPIFADNSENIVEVLDEHIHQLMEIRKSIQYQDRMAIQKFIQHANRIRNIIG